MTDRNLDSGSSRPTSSTSTNKTSQKQLNTTTINNKKQTNELNKQKENSVEKTQHTTVITKTIVETKHVKTNKDDTSSIKLNKNQRRRLKQKQNKNNKSIIKNSDDYLNNNSHTLIINENSDTTVNVTESSQNTSTIDTDALSSTNNVVIRNETFSSLPSSSTSCSSASSSQTTVIDCSGVIDDTIDSYKMGGTSSKIEKNRRELIIESTEISNDDNEKCDENIKIQHNNATTTTTTNQNKTNSFETRPTNTQNIKLSDSQTFIEISSLPLDYDVDVTSKYRVESPPPIVVVVEEDRPNRGAIPKRKLLGQIKKSKSLDDNENIQITEITESEISQSESATSFQSSADVNTAIVSDSEDDVQWETVPELRIPANTTSQIGSFSAIAKCLDETSAPVSTDPAAKRAYFTQDEMNNFREFLQELDLQSQYGYNVLPSNFGQLCMKTVDSKTILSPEKILERRARKRALLESYFIPTFQNPRALDIIHEEGSSDLSDKESTIMLHAHKPEPPRPPLRSSPTDIPWIDEMGDDDVFLDGGQNDEKTPKLVEAKVINVGETVTQETTNWKTERVQSPHDENIEVVYIDEDDGSESSRSDRLSTTSCGDLDDTQEADDEYSKEETLLNQAVEEIKTRKIVEAQSSLENIVDLPFEMQDEQQEQLETVAMSSATIENIKETKEKTMTSSKTEENIKNTKVKVENLQNMEKETSKESNKIIQIDKNVQEHRKISSQNQEKVEKVQINETEKIIKVKSNQEDFKDSTKDVRDIQVQIRTDNPKERNVEIKLEELSKNPKDSDKKPEVRNIDIKIETANDHSNEKVTSQSKSKNGRDFEKANERVVEIKMKEPSKNPKDKNKKGEVRNIEIKIEGTSDQNIEELTSQQKITNIREETKEHNVAIKLEKSGTNPKSTGQKQDIRNIEIKLDEAASNPNTENRTNEQNIKRVEQSKERIVEIKLEKPTANPKETVEKPEIRNVEIKMEVENEQKIDKRTKVTSVENLEENKERVVEITVEKSVPNPKETVKKPEVRNIEIKMETANEKITEKHARNQNFTNVKNSGKAKERIIDIKLEKSETSPKEISKSPEVRNVEIKMETAKEQTTKKYTREQKLASVNSFEEASERVVEITVEKPPLNPKETTKKPEVRNVEIKMETASDKNTEKRTDKEKSKGVKNLENTKERVVEIKLEKSATSPKETMKTPEIRNVEIKMETTKDQNTEKRTSQQKFTNFKDVEEVKERVVEIKLEEPGTSRKENTKKPEIRNVEIKMETARDQNMEKCTSQPKLTNRNFEEAKERIVEIKVEEPTIKRKETDKKSEVPNVEIKPETLNQPKLTNIRDVEEKINMSETRNEEISFKCSKQKIEHNEPLEFYNLPKKQNEKHTEINSEKTQESETKKERVIKVQVQQNNNTKDPKITDSLTERTIPIKLESSSKESNTKSQTSPQERNVPIQLETSSTKTNEKYQSTNFTSGLDTNNTTTIKNLKTSIDTNQFSDEKNRRSTSIEEKSLETREIHQTKHSRFLTNPIKNFEDLKSCQQNKSKHLSNEEKIREDNLKDPELVLSNLISYGPEYFKESDMKIIRLNSQKIVEKMVQFLSKSRSDSDIRKISEFLQKVPMEGVERELQKKIQELVATKRDDLEVEKIHLHGDNNNNHEKIVFDKEFESLFKTIKDLSEERTSTSRPESSNSFGSSSTTNTVKHMPTSSSLTDIHSIIEQELAQTVKSLKEIALEKIKTLPYGLDILEELSHVSEIIKTMTKTLETATNQHLHHNLLTNKKHHPKSAILIDDSPPPVPALPKTISTIDKYKHWIGLPTETDPRLLVCLSPAQRNYEHQQKSTSQHFKYINPDQLLDMHTKFMERRGYHESIPPLGENKTTSNKKTPLGSGHRLLRIIQEQNQPQDIELAVEPQPKTTTPGCVSDDEEISKYLGQPVERNYHSDTEFVPIQLTSQPYYTTSEPDNARQYQRSQSATLPQTKPLQSEIIEEKIFPYGTRKEPIFIPNLETYRRKHGSAGSPKPPLIDERSDETKRLRIQSLSEWMSLARRKAESNETLLPSSVAKNTKEFDRQLSENIKTSKGSVDNELQSIYSRRFSLPQEIHEKQLKYILEKEREIEREIAELEAEKRRLASVMEEPTSTRIPIQTTTTETSNQCEIKTEVEAEGRPEIRWLRHPNTMPASCMIYGDFFRKQMFDEYMSKIAEREERKQQKVIKISKSSNSCQETTTPNADGDTERRGSTTTSTSVDPINFKTLVNIENEFMNRVKERKAKLGIHDMSSEDEGTTQNMPKHLEEFVQFTSTSESSETVKNSTSSKDECSRVSIEESQMRQDFCRTSKPRNNRYSEVAYTKLGKQILKPIKKKNYTETTSLLHEIDSSLSSLARGFLLERGVWSPGQKQQSSTSDKFSSTFSETKIQKSTSQPNSLPLKSSQSTSISSTTTTTAPLSLTIKPANEVIWTPKSASPSPSVERKEFRPVNFQSPTLERKHKPEKTSNDKKPESKDSIPPPPWENADSSQKTTSTSISSKTIESRLTTSHSAPVTGLNSLQATAASSPASSLASHTTISTSTARLPRAQNPTITLLQKAREGQLPRGASYIDESKRTPPRKTSDERPPLIGPNEILYSVKNEYLNDTKIDSPHRKMVDLGARKFEGIGPTTRDGMPIVLRSEVKENNQAKWYKRMYETIHKTKDDDYVTIRYKQRKGRYPYTASSGYLSEPEPNADLYMYDSDAGVSPRCATLDRRYTQQSSRDKENYVSSTMPRNTRSMSASETIKHGSGIYRNQPGRIEDYVPGHSSISEKEAKEWWDEVMEIFNGHLEQQKLVPQHSKSYMAQALKESGYESDSTLIFKRRDDTTQQQLSPQEQKEVYKAIQRGGEVPLHGLRKPAPERPKEEAGIEYFPISPTLTRIRVHRNKTLGNQQYLCYPITSITHTATTKCRSKSPPKQYPLQAPLPAHSRLTTIPPRVPSPPRRKSSRYNSTLKLVSNITVSSTMPKKPVDAKKSVKSTTSNVQYLKDRINCKINLPHSVTQSTSKTPSATTSGVSKTNRLKVTRSIATSPIDKTRIPLKVPTSTISSRLRNRLDATRTSTPDISTRLRTQSQSPSRVRGRHASEPCTSSVIKTGSSLSTKSVSRPVSLERTFGVAKRKAELSTLATKSGSDSRLGRTSDLISPTEVKKVLHQSKMGSKDIPTGTIIKKSATLYSSVKNNLGIKGRDKILNTTAYITPHGREILKESQKLLATSTKIVDDSKSRDVTKKQTRKASIVKPVQKVVPKVEPKTQPRSNGTNKNKTKIKKIKKPEEIVVKRKDSKTVREKENIEKYVDKTVGSVEIVKKSRGSETFSGYGRVTSKDIDKQKKLIQSDKFFQKLLMRDLGSPTSSVTSYRNTSVLEKAKMFQSYESKQKNYEPTKIPNVYLSHRKPVTESKFRYLDLQRYSLPIIGNNPYYGYGVSEKIRHFDSLSQIDDDTMTIISSLRGRSPDSYGRSSSEPPIKMGEFRPTREIRSPRTLTPSPSPSPVRSPALRKILSIKSPKNFNEPPPPMKTIRTRSAGDAEAVKREIRRSLKKQDPMSVSTSSLTLSNISDHSEYQTYITELIHSHRRSERFKDLQNFYIALERKGQLEKTTSSSELRPSRRSEEIIDFDLWKKVRNYEKAEQELNKLYKQLKMVEKEKGFLFQSSDANVIRWKREKDRALRIRDKSIKDLKEHFAELKNELTALHLAKQRDLEITKDTYKPLWRGNSVVNLAQHMIERRTKSESRAYQPNSIPNKTFRDLAGIGSRIWSSLSMDQVNAIKSQLSDIYNLTSPSRKLKSPIQKSECVIEIPPNEKMRKDQVNSKLHVRSCSLSVTEKKEKAPSTPAKKSDSIGAIRVSPTSPDQKKTLSETEKRRLSSTLSKEALDRLNKRQELKHRESLILAKETRGAVAASNAKLSSSRQKLNEISSLEPRTCYSLETSLESDSLNKELSSEKSNFVLVLTPSNDTEEKAKVKNVLNEWAQKPSEKPTSKRMSASETESASSDASTKTVICKSDKNKDELQKKIYFFEKKTEEKSVETVAQKFQDQGSQTNHIPEENKATLKKSKKLVPSQSFADLKELFGEQERVTYSSSPLPKDTRFSSPTNSSQIYTASNSPVRFISDASSQESIYRSRSLSPDPEKYWRAYLALVKNGDVLKLKNKFESMEDFKKQNLHQQPKRYRSDPELTRIFLSKKDTDLDRIIIRGQEHGDVEWLRRRYETKSSPRGRTRIRNRGRNISPIPKHPIRIEDRYMPHINVISKLASLKSKTLSKQKSSSDKDVSSVVPSGEVKKLKTKFDSPPTQTRMSLIGQMFTSSPNINELRDISPYLAGPWIAHKFPKRQDNSRSLSSPESLLTENNGTYPPRRQSTTHIKSRPKSVSPPRSKKPLSILKTPSSGTITIPTTPTTTTQSDIFAAQKFNPAIHRPVSRYQPSPTVTDHSLQESTCRSWWTSEPSVRPTVKFKEPEFAPIPPPKGSQHHSKDFGPESPRRYVENEVTIHYRSPIRQEIKEVIAEEELARRQAEAMRRIYQEERRRKYLQELHDMNSRRHTDNFTPSQKSPIPLNRYDDFDDMTLKSSKSRDRTPEPRLIARALFNFVGQTPRELTFKKGDIIYVRRQIDKNWYEGEHNAMLGLFPFNYVEIIPFDNVKTMAKKPHEGQARAKFNFIAQTHLELSLAKGEHVILTRRVDENWFEGRIGNKKGIFPVSYVEIISYPGETPSDLSKPVAAPAAHSLLLNGSAGGKQSMGSHHYQPTYSSQTSPMSSSYHHAKPVNITPISSGASQQYGSLSRQQPAAPQTASSKSSVNINQTLHIDTHSEPIPYRALYKYRPQNEDELELLEGDIVYVLEKCDDGWYVGSSQRTGAFGTFPGNYVERVK